jgi:hypothetical protein
MGARRPKAKGNGNGRTVMHPWQFHTAPPAAEGPAPGSPRVMDECHLDCQGRRRHFRLQEHHQPFRSLLSATELLDGEPIGMRLLQPFNDEREMPLLSSANIPSAASGADNCSHGAEYCHRALR